MTHPKQRDPLKAIRANCLDCSGTAKAVTWCSCDGLHSGWCDLWPYRFGRRPATIRQRVNPALVTPEMMPPANANLDDLPADPRRYRPAEVSGRAVA